MNRLRLVGGVTLLLGFVAVLVWVPSDGTTEVDSSPEPEAAVARFTDSRSCQPCHPDVYAEWSSSYHAQSFTDPLVVAKEQSNNFRKRQCIPCHAPRPVFDHGIGKGARVVERVAHRELGVDCLACHQHHGEIVGTRSIEAPCQPRATPELSSPALCAPCHNQHETVDEWEKTSFAAEGIGCLDCHMQPVERVAADGSTRSGRDHRFLGGHHPPLLRDALLVSTDVQGAPTSSELVVSLTNTGAGHNYPSDARHRCLDVVVTLIGPGGIEYPAREPRGPGQQGGTARRRFQNPYRNSPEERENEELYGRANTQIPAGVTERFVVPMPGTVERAEVAVYYKLTPLFSDEEATLVHRETVDLSLP